jgi:hypothetical protein
MDSVEKDIEELARETGYTLTSLDREFLGLLARTGWEVTADTLEAVDFMSEEQEEKMMRSLERKIEARSVNHEAMMQELLRRAAVRRAAVRCQAVWRGRQARRWVHAAVLRLQAAGQRWLARQAGWPSWLAGRADWRPELRQERGGQEMKHAEFGEEIGRQSGAGEGGGMSRERGEEADDTGRQPGEGEGDHISRQSGVGEGGGEGVFGASRQPGRGEDDYEISRQPGEVEGNKQEGKKLGSPGRRQRGPVAQARSTRRLEEWRAEQENAQQRRLGATPGRGPAGRVPRRRLFGDRWGGDRGSPSPGSCDPRSRDTSPSP